MLLDEYGRPLRSAAKEHAIAELKANAHRSLQAAYDAAQTTHENAQHWRFADDLSAAATNSLAVRQILRRRSRYECLQSNSFCKGMVGTLANDFVSTGPRLQLEMEDRELSHRIENAFRQWARQVRLNKKLRTARLSKCVDGEAFLVAITNRRIRGPVQLDIRGVESDQISTPGWIDGQTSDAVDGIRFDPDTGDPIEYHLLREHPGHRGQVIAQNAKIDLDPVDVIHLFNVDRPGQCRGVPELTPSLPLIPFVRRFTLATVAAAEVAANYAAVLKTQTGAFELDEADAEIFKPYSAVEIKRGMMAALPYGYELQQLKAEQPTANFEAFRASLMMEIARPIHMPRNKVLGDSSGYNFSSAKMDDQIYYHSIDIERGDWDIDALDRIFDWWLDEAAMTPGFIDLPTLEYVPRRWTWPRPKSVQPYQEARAVTHLIDAGLMLEEDYLHSQQIDPDRFYEARREQAERRAEVRRIEQPERTLPRPTASDVPNRPATGIAA